MWLIYALVNTPDFIIRDELYRMMYKLPPESDTEVYRKNYVFDDIPDELKIKKYEFIREEDKIIEVIERIKLCRSYMATITLGGIASV